MTCQNQAAECLANLAQLAVVHKSVAFQLENFKSQIMLKNSDSTALQIVIYLTQIWLLHLEPNFKLNVLAGFGKDVLILQSI